MNHLDVEGISKKQEARSKRESGIRNQEKNSFFGSQLS
jgi:hypothetical protein